MTQLQLKLENEPYQKEILVNIQREVDMGKLTTVANFDKLTFQA